jgi:hypothetical protein
MITEPRVKRLRELIAELEQLPESPERDRLLSEFRSRAVDLDTGVTPRAILPLREIPEARPPRRESAPKLTKVAPPAPPAAIEVARAAEDEPFCVEERLSLEDALRHSGPHASTRGDGAVAPWTLGLRG